MIATDSLKEEHNAIKVMLQILTKVSQKLDSKAAVNPEHLAQMVDFIRTFADKCHHGKEEDLLFGAMEAAGIPRQGGPIGVMLEEHDEGRGYVRGMAEAAASYKTGDSQAGPKFAQNARNYVGLLTQHIDKEDNILYPMADDILSEEKQKELFEKFEKVELERIGRGKHEELHKLLHGFEKTYLK